MVTIKNGIVKPSLVTYHTFILTIYIFYFVSIRRQWNTDCMEWFNL